MGQQGYSSLQVAERISFFVRNKHLSKWDGHSTQKTLDILDGMLQGQTHPASLWASALGTTIVGDFKLCTYVNDIFSNHRGICRNFRIFSIEKCFNYGSPRSVGRFASQPTKKKETQSFNPLVGPLGACLFNVSWKCRVFLIVLRDDLSMIVLGGFVDFQTSGHFKF